MQHVYIYRWRVYTHSMSTICIHIETGSVWTSCIYIYKPRALYLNMVMRWSWGDMPPQEVQHIAELIIQDIKNLQGPGLDLSLLTMLASIGSDGTSPQNCHRDLLSRLPKLGLPSMSLLKVPLSHAVFGISEAMSGIVWPHQFFAALYHNHRDMFFTYVVPSLDTMREFWEAVKGRDPQI